MTRSVLLVVHTGRRGAVSAARDLADRLGAEGWTVRALADEADSLRCDAVTPVSADGEPARGPRGRLGGAVRGGRGWRPRASLPPARPSSSRSAATAPCFGLRSSPAPPAPPCSESTWAGWGSLPRPTGLISTSPLNES